MKAVRWLINWTWEHLDRLALLAGWLASIALPAWAVHVSSLFAEYAPVSWVTAGLAGMIVSALSYAALAWGRVKWTRANYDARMAAKGSYVDPLQRAFEDRRIFLNDFCLPSHPLVEGKTFINCEIIGPANILLQFGNSLNEQRDPKCDAVVLDPSKQFFNALIFRNCTFRSCSFQRVTFYFAAAEYDHVKHIQWLNWIVRTDPQLALPFQQSEDPDATAPVPAR